MIKTEVKCFKNLYLVKPPLYIVKCKSKSKLFILNDVAILIDHALCSIIIHDISAIIVLNR
jgi:hypothetical protein